MRADPQKILEAGELDWAFGELLRLIWEGKRIGIVAHELDPPLFHACMRVLAWQPYEVREELTWIINATRYWDVARWGRRANAGSR
jgi:hypothetical protein